MREIWGAFSRTLTERRVVPQKPHHSFEIVVSADLVDRYGHVGNSKYLEFGDRAAQAFVANYDASVEHLESEHGLVPRKRATTGIEWRGEAFEGDRLTVCTNFLGIGTSSIRLKQRIEKDGVVITDLGIVTYVMVNKNGVPTRVPDEVRKKLRLVK